MKKQVSKNAFIAAITRFVFRLTILNICIVAFMFFIALMQNIIEASAILNIRFPFALYLTILILSNWVYVLGNLYEIIYLHLWDKKIDFIALEKQFFTASFVMALIVSTTGIALYFINYFR